MLDSPITLILLGISAASALASYTAARRRRARSAPPALSALSDADLLAALAALQPRATSMSGTTQRSAAHTPQHSISATHSVPGIREAGHPESVSLAIEQDHEVRRRLTLLVVEEIERRLVRTER
jgi:hypothetical protein